MRRVILFLMLFMLGGCEVSTHSTEEQFAVDTILAMRSGNFGAVDASMVPEIRKELTPEVFDRMSAMIPPGSPELRGVNVRSEGMTVIKTLTYQVGDGEKWALVDITYQPGRYRPQLLGIQVRPLKAPLSWDDRTVSRALGPIHYLWIVAMIVAVTVSITGLVSALRTPDLRLKWAWAIACLFSFVTFSMDWNDGLVSVMPLSILLLGAGAFKAGLGPWIMQVAVPLPAIIFLIRKHLGHFKRDPLERVDPEIFS